MDNALIPVASYTAAAQVGLIAGRVQSRIPPGITIISTLEMLRVFPAISGVIGQDRSCPWFWRSFLISRLVVLA